MNCNNFRKILPKLCGTEPLLTFIANAEITTNVTENSFYLSKKPLYSSKIINLQSQQTCKIQAIQYIRIKTGTKKYSKNYTSIVGNVAGEEKKKQRERIKPKSDRIKKKKKLHFRCFLYKWSSVIKEVESCPVCLCS